MRKLIYPALLMLLFAVPLFADRNFIEGTDYFVDFTQNDETRAAVLHINFISLMPALAEAEKILKDQLKVYGKILENERQNALKEEQADNKDATKKKAKDKNKGKKKPNPKTMDAESLKAYLEEEEDEEIFKNIVGSVWYTADGTPENMQKIKFTENSSAFVWLGKTQKIVAFPDYIKLLKKDKEDKKQKEKEKAQLYKQLQAQESAPEDEEPQQ